MCHKLNVSKMETIYKEIHCYLGEKDFAFLQSESILESDVIDDEAKELEDMEANAFAALLLATEDRLEEIPRDLIRFGSLSEKMYELEKWESIRDERLESDKARLKEIVKLLGKPAR